MAKSNVVMLSNGRRGSSGNNAASADLPEIPGGPKGTSAVQLAIQSISRFYERSKGENGFEAIEKARKAVYGELTGYVFQIAQAAVTLAGNDLGMACGLFKSLCKRAEEAVQQAHPQDGKVVAITKLLPSWAPVKSSILAGMDKKKIDPSKVKDATEFMQKVRERANNGANSTATDPEDSDFMTDSCAAAWDMLTETVKAKSAEEQDMAAPLLIAVAKQIKALKAPKAAKPARTGRVRSGQTEGAQDGVQQVG